MDGAHVVGVVVTLADHLGGGLGGRVGIRRLVRVAFLKSLSGIKKR